MSKKDLMYNFIKCLEKKKLLTEFIKCIFDYDELYDYNYLFRVQNDGDKIIIDIYDNISENRFNRYIFDFSGGLDRIVEDKNVIVTLIHIDNVRDSNIKLYKLAYLFKLDLSKMINYGKSFLSEDIIMILKEIIK